MMNGNAAVLEHFELMSSSAARTARRFHFNFWYCCVILMHGSVAVKESFGRTWSAVTSAIRAAFVASLFATQVPWQVQFLDGAGKYGARSVDLYQCLLRPSWN